jgi:hypothetical protein
MFWIFVITFSAGFIYAPQAQHKATSPTRKTLGASLEASQLIKDNK